MYLADTLSRHCNRDEAHLTRSAFEEEIEGTPRIEEINQMIVSEKQMLRLQNKTGKDEVLQMVKAIIQNGWPESKHSLPVTVTPYFHIRNELVVQNGLIFRGDRVVILKALRKEMIENLHVTHQGVESSLRRARESIYWPNMNSKVKDYISRCEICLTYPPHQQKEPLLSHEIPDRPWAKIAADLFQFENKDYLVAVDYYSNFFEVDRKAVTKKLKAHITRYGVPDEIVPDNGPQFAAQQFRIFAQSYGFKHMCTSPHYPQSNGKAESAVKQAKKILRMARASGNDFYFGSPERAQHSTGETQHEPGPENDEQEHQDNPPGLSKYAEATLASKFVRKHPSKTSQATKILWQSIKGPTATSRRWQGENPTSHLRTKILDWWASGETSATPFLWSTGGWQGVHLKSQAFAKVRTKGRSWTSCRLTRGHRGNAYYNGQRGEHFPREPPGRGGEPHPDNGDKEALSTHGNGEYRTCSRRVSVKPCRFNDFVMDWRLLESLISQMITEHCATSFSWFHLVVSFWLHFFFFFIEGKILRWGFN